jgi:succinylarginine dihydrolase
MDRRYYEVNFDGIPGPTHYHGGLSYGNIASMSYKDTISNPKMAAKQSLMKMRFLANLGLVQGVLPPHERPYLPLFRQLGFSGSDEDVINAVHHQAPDIYYACCSASPMWAANAATVTPSPDSGDERLHITPANLSYTFHRSFEKTTTAAVLKSIFPDHAYFTHHAPLPSSRNFSDEGAANHTRFCKGYGNPGIHLFVYGRSGFREAALAPTRYPARQTFEASQAIARQHLIPPERAIFAQQNPTAIDAGVFHNDVASVGNENVFMYHEQAFVSMDIVLKELQNKFRTYCNSDMVMIPISRKALSLEKAVKTYLFNSQIVTLEDGLMALIAPTECQHDKEVETLIDSLISDPSNPIKEVHYVEIRESMQNGGGPACLRLRIVLNDDEVNAANPHVFLSEELYQTLHRWIDKHYRDRLSLHDLSDQLLYRESQAALGELYQILHL